MKPGKVERYILEKIEEDGGILLSLIDPDKTPFDKAAKIAKAAADGGTDIILVGGSIGAVGIILDRTTKMIKESVDIPVVLFPGSPEAVTRYADATYFMYAMNSRNVHWITTVQTQAAPSITKINIEPIPTAYIILEPGGTVGKIIDANMIPRDKADLAAATALAGQYMGAHVIITDSGSGVKVPPALNVVQAIKSVVSVPYFYAGGCRTSEQAKSIIKAGADGIHIGTAFETHNGNQIKKRVAEMSKAIKEAGKHKIKHPRKVQALFSSLHMPSVERLKRKWEIRVERLRKVKIKFRRKKGIKNSL